MIHVCEAPICSQDTSPNWRKEVVWFPGEEVCGSKPLYLFQKKQLQINKELKAGTFKNTSRAFTASELEGLSI